MNKRNNSSPFSRDKINQLPRDPEPFFFNNQANSFNLSSQLHAFKYQADFTSIQQGNNSIPQMNSIQAILNEIRKPVASSPIQNNCENTTSALWQKIKNRNESPASFQNLPNTILEKNDKERQVNGGGGFSEETPKFKINKIDNLIGHLGRPNGILFQDIDRFKGQRGSCFSFGHDSNKDEDVIKFSNSQEPRKANQMQNSCFYEGQFNKKKHVSFCPQSLENLASGQHLPPSANFTQISEYPSSIGNEYHLIPSSSYSVPNELVNQPVFESFAPTTNFLLEQNLQNDINKQSHNNNIYFQPQNQVERLVPLNKEKENKNFSEFQNPLLEALLPLRQRIETVHEGQESYVPSSNYKYGTEESKIEALRKKLVKPVDQQLLQCISKPSTIRKTESKEYIEIIELDKSQVEKIENKQYAKAKVGSEEIQSQNSDIHFSMKFVSKRAEPETFAQNNYLKRLIDVNESHQNQLSGRAQLNATKKSPINQFNKLAVQDESQFAQTIQKKAAESQEIQRKTAQLIGEIMHNRQKQETQQSREIYKLQDVISNYEKKQISSCEKRYKQEDPSQSVLQSREIQIKSGELENNSISEIIVDNDKKNPKVTSKLLQQQLFQQQIYTATIDLNSLTVDSKNILPNDYQQSKESSSKICNNEKDKNKSQTIPYQQGCLSYYEGKVISSIPQNNNKNTNISCNNNNNNNTIQTNNNNTIYNNNNDINNTIQNNNNTSSSQNIPDFPSEEQRQFPTRSKQAKEYLFAGKEIIPNQSSTIYKNEVLSHQLSQSSQQEEYQQSSSQPVIQKLQLGATNSAFSTRVNSTGLATMTTMSSSSYAKEIQECFPGSYLKPSPMPIIQNQFLTSGKQKKNINSCNYNKKEEINSLCNEISTFSTQQQKKQTEISKNENSRELSSSRYHHVKTQSTSENQGRSLLRQNDTLRHSTVIISSTNLNSSQEKMRDEQSQQQQQQQQQFQEQKIKKNNFAAFMCKQNQYTRENSPSKIRQVNNPQYPSLVSNQDSSPQIYGLSSTIRQLNKPYDYKSENSLKNGESNKKGLFSLPAPTNSYCFKSSYKINQKPQPKLFSNGSSETYSPYLQRSEQQNNNQSNSSSYYAFQHCKTEFSQQQ